MTAPSPSPVSAVELIAVAPAVAERLWAAALPFLTKSYARSQQHVPADLLANVIWKKKVLWLLVETAGETEEIVGAGITGLYLLSEGAKMCKIEHFAASGNNIGNWLHLRREIEKYAKAEGCDRVLFEARLGWTKYLLDYEPVAVILEKRL